MKQNLQNSSTVAITQNVPLVTILHTKRGQEEKWDVEGQANDTNILKINGFCLFIHIFYRKTYQLGHQDHFNRKFEDTGLEYTYMVPSNTAWDQIQAQYSSAFKVSDSELH